MSFLSHEGYPQFLNLPELKKNPNPAMLKNLCVKNSHILLYTSFLAEANTVLIPSGFIQNQ